MKKYTDSHTWVEIHDEVATIGITDYAEKELGSVVYVELPKLKHRVAAGQEAVVIESTKAAIDIYSPLSGEIIATNTHLIDNPETINQSAESAGWLFKLKLQDPEEVDTLLDEPSYHELISS